MSGAALPSAISTAYTNGYKIYAWDTTTGKLIGAVATLSTSTMTIGSGGIPFASSGSSDSIHLTTDLWTVSDNGHGGERGANFEGFSIVSNTTLTGGFAMQAHGLFDSGFTKVWADSSNSQDSSSHGHLCGGFWFNGSGGVVMHYPMVYSTQNCDDGIRINSNLGGSAELLLFGGAIGGTGSGTITGFTNGIHMAGGIGGVRCDSTNIHQNLTAWLVDQTAVATNNREFDLGSTCAIDTNQNSGITINDSGDGGPFDIAGWIASTQQGPGIDLKAASGNNPLILRGENIYNNCGDAVLDETTTTKVYIDQGVSINNNGNASLGSACTTWQAGAGAGHGYGIYATSSTNKVRISPLVAYQLNNSNNTAGGYNSNITPQAFNIQKFTALGSVTAASPVCAVQGCTPTGTGYGTSVTGTMTLNSGGGFTCSTYPVLNVSTNGSGNITTVNSVTTAGSCTAMGAMQNATWTVGGSLSAGSGAIFALTWTPTVQTYTPSPGMRLVRVYSHGAGGQGGGGALVLSGTASSGGGGGGGGEKATCDITATTIGTNQSLTVGLGGRNGGTPAVTASSAGAIGQAGGQTFFGSSGTELCTGHPGGAGYGGINAATAAGGAAGGGWAADGNNGASGSGGTAQQGGGAGGNPGSSPSTQDAGGGAGTGQSSGAAASGGGGFGGGAGGGSGAGLTTGPATATGGNGGSNLAQGSTGASAASGGTANNNGSDGGAASNASPSSDCGSAGAGGGSALTTTVAGNGGAGYTCAGGGGGGSAVNGTNSAAGFGGRGGDGEIDVEEFF